LVTTSGMFRRVAGDHVHSTNAEINEIVSVV